MASVKLARNAMATRFEIVVCGENEPALRAAAEEALDEVQRIEAQLSLYRLDSEVAHLNARGAHEWVRVEPRLFRLLQQARAISRETGGAFDITVAPLARCWGFMGGRGKRPAKAAILEARNCVGMNLIELNAEKSAVHFARAGVMLDFGAMGKGYAIEKAVEVLREAGVASAIIHGGTSTVHGLGKPPNEPAWKVAIEAPAQSDPEHPHPGPLPSDGRGNIAAPPQKGQEQPVLLSVVELHDAALSVSAVWGKSFATKGKTYGHIIDPRTGYPADAADLAAVVLPSATETDALSTALLTLGIDGHEHIASLRSEIRTLVMKRGRSGESARIKTHGMRRA